MKQSALLSSIPNLVHGFTTKQDDAASQEKIRQTTASGKQVHKDNIIWVSQWEKAQREADAIGTKTPNIAVGIYTADCAPILLAAINAKQQAFAVMAIHAGWRGTALKIAETALQNFWQTLPAQAERILAVVGPTISQKAFEVGQEVIDAFPGSDKTGIAHFLRTEGERKKYLFDLPGENARQLKDTAQRLGPLPLSVEVLPECTFFAKETYHSFRRDRENAGRNLSFISFHG